MHMMFSIFCAFNIVMYLVWKPGCMWILYMCVTKNLKLKYSFGQRCFELVLHAVALQAENEYTF